MNIQQLLREKRGTIVDVRTPEEFQAAHVPGAVNIPLQEVAARMDELKHLKAPLILCCASGNRSGMAERFLAGAGVDCLNAGSWLDVNYLQSQLN